MCLCLFLCLMYERDDSTSTNVSAQPLAKNLAEKAGKLVDVSTAFVYCAYKEWRDGQEEVAIEAKEKHFVKKDCINCILRDLAHASNKSNGRKKR